MLRTGAGPTLYILHTVLLAAPVQHEVAELKPQQNELAMAGVIFSNGAFETALEPAKEGRTQHELQVGADDRFQLDCVGGGVLL